jgi:lysophospholipase L1-like esterase
VETPSTAPDARLPKALFVTMVALLPAALIFLSADYAASYANRAHVVLTTAPAMEYLEFDPLQMWRLRKGYDNGSIRISPDGFRADRQLASPAGRKLVFLVGGSTVFGVGLRQEQTISHFLQELADRFQPDERLEFVNAGVTGYYSTQELIHVERAVLSRRPYMVISLDGRNDAFYGMRPDYTPDAVSYHSLLRHGLGALDPYYAAEDAPWAPFHVTRWIGEHLASRRFNWLPEFESADLRLNPAALELYLRNARSMHALLQGTGVRHVHFLQPTINYPDRELAPEEGGMDQARYVAPLKRAYRSLAEESEDSLPHDWFRGVVDLSRDSGQLFIDNVHLTERGARAVAERIYADVWRP